MGVKLVASINLNLLPDTRVEVMENLDGIKEEYICIPIKAAGIKKAKGGGNYLPLSIVQMRAQYNWNTHCIFPSWNKSFVVERESRGFKTPIIGYASNEFQFVPPVDMDSEDVFGGL